MFLGQFPYTIVHIPGAENCWRDLLLRWVTRPGGPVCVHANVKYTEVLFAGSDKFPTKEVADPPSIRHWAWFRWILKRYTGWGTITTALSGCRPRPTLFGKRLLVCPHLKGAGHHGIGATMARLEWRCVWEGMADDVWDMTRLCLYCWDTKAEALVPCTLTEPLMGERRTQLCILNISTRGRER